jgi:hypothetical protein
MKHPYGNMQHENGVKNAIVIAKCHMKQQHAKMQHANEVNNAVVGKNLNTVIYKHGCR